MAKPKSKPHPQLEELKISAALFVALIFVIAFLALFVHSAVHDAASADPERVEQTIQKIGQVHPRQNS